MEKTIYEKFKLIVDFIGLELEPDQEIYPDFYLMNDDYNPDDIVRCCLSDMQFAELWEWLMPVVERICNHKFEDGICSYLRTFGMKDERDSFMVRFNRGSLFYGDSLIEATFEAVSDFCSYYNDLKSQRA